MARIDELLGSKEYGKGIRRELLKKAVPLKRTAVTDTPRAKRSTKQFAQPPATFAPKTDAAPRPQVGSPPVEEGAETNPLGGMPDLPPHLQDRMKPPDAVAFANSKLANAERLSSIYETMASFPSATPEVRWMAREARRYLEALRRVYNG